MHEVPWQGKGAQDMCDQFYFDSIVLSKMSRYFWVVGGRREGMEKGMDEWEELITEKGTRALVLGWGQDKDIILKAVECY